MSTILQLKRKRKKSKLCSTYTLKTPRASPTLCPLLLTQAGTKTRAPLEAGANRPRFLSDKEGMDTEGSCGVKASRVCHPKICPCGIKLILSWLFWGVAGIWEKLEKLWKQSRSCLLVRVIYISKGNLHGWGCLPVCPRKRRVTQITGDSCQRGHPLESLEQSLRCEQSFPGHLPTSCSLCVLLHSF